MSEEMASERPYTRKELEEQAIEMALKGRWQEAERLNRLLLQRNPDEVDTLNRLGKALLEMGQYDQAQATYSRALELDPYNRIARRNLQRLETLIGEAENRTGAGVAERDRLLPDLFISESGKSAVVPLRGVSDPKVLKYLSRGEVVHLEPSEQTVLVKDDKGAILGRLDARVGHRLAEFIHIGNRYVAAIAEVNESGAKVFVRETYQHQRLIGRPSFPPIDLGERTEIVRPYMRDWGLRLQETLEVNLDYDDDDEDDGQTQEEELEQELGLEEDDNNGDEDYEALTDSDE